MVNNALNNAMNNLNLDNGTSFESPFVIYDDEVQLFSIIIPIV